MKAIPPIQAAATRRRRRRIPPFPAAICTVSLAGMCQRGINIIVVDAVAVVVVV